MSTKTKKAHILRDFNDAGTERRFTAGSTVDLDEGTYANYAAAGLVSDKAPKEEAKTGSESAPKTA